MESVFTQTYDIKDNMVDCQGYLKPSQILFIAQDMGGRHCKELTLSYDDMAARGLFWAVSRHRVQITRLPMSGETIRVETWAMPAVVLVSVWKDMGFFGLILLSGMISIDRGYYEAAELDGATFMQKVRYIVFPLVKPTTLFLLVTGVIGSFQVFMNAFMMTGGGPDNSTTMIGLLIYKNAFEYSKYGLACAQAILLAIVIAIISLLQFKLMGVDVEY